MPEEVPDVSTCEKIDKKLNEFKAKLCEDNFTYKSMRQQNTLSIKRLAMTEKKEEVLSKEIDELKKQLCEPLVIEDNVNKEDERPKTSHKISEILHIGAEFEVMFE